MSIKTTTKTERELRKMASNAGLTVLDVRLGPHYKVRVEAPDGRQTTIIAGATVSDYRARKNQEARFKRFANGREVYEAIVPPHRTRSKR